MPFRLPTAICNRTTRAIRGVVKFNLIALSEAISGRPFVTGMDTTVTDTVTSGSIFVTEIGAMTVSRQMALLLL